MCEFVLLVRWSDLAVQQNVGREDPSHRVQDERIVVVTGHDGVFNLPVHPAVGVRRKHL